MKIYKILLIILTTLSPNVGFSLDIGDGHASPEVAANSFLGALKQSNGIKDAVEQMNGEPKKENELIKKAKETLTRSPLEEKLSEKFGSDKLISYKKTGQDVKLGGKMVRMYYDLYFQSGPKKEAVIVIMQPRMTGNYYIMDVDFSNSVISDEESR